MASNTTTRIQDEFLPGSPLPRLNSELLAASGIVVVTSSQYSAMTTKQPGVLYVVTDGSSTTPAGLYMVYPLQISGSAPSATQGTAYNFTPTVTGGSGTKTYNFYNLPAGLSGNSLTGVVSGTPTVSGNVPNFSIVVSDNNGSVASQEFTIGAGVIGGAGVVSNILPPFAFEAETETLSASFTTAPTRRRKMTNNTAIKRLKDGGVWNTLNGFWWVGADNQATARNWKSPGTYDLTFVGSVAFSADTQVFGGSATAYIDTNMPLSLLDPNSHTFAMYTADGGAKNGPDMGAQNTSSIGVTFTAVSNANNVPALRSASAAITSGIGVAADWTEGGFYGFTRRDANNIQPFHGPVNRGAVALASTGAMGAQTIHLLGTNTGAHASSPRGARGWAIGSGLTDTQMALLADVMQSLHVSYTQGSYDTYESGLGNGEVNADLIVYGTTPQGITAAYEAKRRGRSVAICGGWRDRHVGGMSSGGLGQTDWYADPATTIGGLAGYLIKNLQTLGGKTGTDINFEPRNFELLMRRLLDPKNAEGLDIPIYWSDGVDTVQKTGDRITSFRTVDGRVFKGRYFSDASYEADLARKAGLSLARGREAAGTGLEAANGYRGLTTSFGGSEHQFKKKDGSLANVDPYLTPGNASSGLLPGVRSLSSAPAIGAADDEVQSYNFRCTMTNSRARRIPLSNVAPPNYDKLNYEALGRLFAIDPTLTLGDVILNVSANQIAVLSDGSYIFDLNAKGGMSLDRFGLSKPYPDATYADRELNWKAHENYIRGFFYYLQYENDSRIPSAVRTSALNLGFDIFHYPRPHPNDAAHWMPQLYVREPRRIKGDIIWDANDIGATDGTTPRSTKTIAVASYPMDSHHVTQYADPNGGTPRIWNEGNFYTNASGGTDLISPVPYEVITPKTSECTNLTVTFGVSATHAAFGAIRMEVTAMMLGQAAGMAAHIAMQNNDQAIQSIDYNALRSALLSSPTLTNEPTPYLPQVN